MPSPAKAAQPPVNETEEARRLVREARQAMSANKFDEAIVHFQRAIAIKPGYAEALNNLNFVLKKTGKGE